MTPELGLLELDDFLEPGEVPHGRRGRGGQVDQEVTHHGVSHDFHGVSVIGGALLRVFAVVVQLERVDVLAAEEAEVQQVLVVVGLHHVADSDLDLKWFVVYGLYCV